MIDDMGFHHQAWYDMLRHLGAKLSWEEVKHQMYGSNHELLERVFGPGHFTREQMDEISMNKERRYQEAYLPHLSLFPGLPDLLGQARDNGIKMAIASAAIPFNIDFVLDNLAIRQYFRAVVSALDVKRSKPDPEVFLKAADLLNQAPASCLVFEDAPKGVEAAARAGMECIVVTSTHEPEEFRQYSNIRSFIADYRGWVQP